MNDTIIKAIDEAIDNIVTSGPVAYCDDREDIITCGNGYAWYPDHEKPQDFTMDSWVVAALMKDGTICLVDGGGDWELVEGYNVGSQGIAALKSLVPCMPNGDKYEYQREYLDDYIANAKRVWLNDIIVRLFYEEGVDDEALEAAIIKAHTDDDKDAILYVLDHITDVVDILGRL